MSSIEVRHKLLLGHKIFFEEVQSSPVSMSRLNSVKLSDSWCPTTI